MITSKINNTNANAAPEIPVPLPQAVFIKTFLLFYLYTLIVCEDMIFVYDNYLYFKYYFAMILRVRRKK